MSCPLKQATARIRLIIVRHGESKMNILPGLVGGQHNHVPLTAKGVVQATLLGQRLRFDRARFDHVYTSTAVRAKQTAEIALQSAGLTACPVEESPALLEQAQGDFEGKERGEVYTKEVFDQMFDEHMDFAAPGGESLRDVQERATSFLMAEVDKWKVTSAAEGREVVLGVFCHGGCIRTLLHHYCGLHDRDTWLVTQDNCCINELLIDWRGVATVRTNDTAHLRYTMQPPQLLTDLLASEEPTTKEATTNAPIAP